MEFSKVLTISSILIDIESFRVQHLRSFVDVVLNNSPKSNQIGSISWYKQGVIKYSLTHVDLYHLIQADLLNQALQDPNHNLYIHLLMKWTYSPVVKKGLLTQEYTRLCTHVNIVGHMSKWTQQHWTCVQLKTIQHISRAHLIKILIETITTRTGNSYV